MSEKDVAVVQFVRPLNLLGGEPSDGVAANAVVAGHVKAVRALPRLIVKGVDREHFVAMGVHDRDTGGEPAYLLFGID